MGFKGSVESFSLADVFQNLAMNQQTGVLRVYTTAGDERLVLFQDGQVQSVSAGPGKPLVVPEVFLARGYLSPEQLQAGLAGQNAASASPLRCLVEQAVLSDEQVAEVVRLQVEEEIFDLFGWDKANFEFNEGPPAEGVFSDAGGGKPLALLINHLIMEAARRVDEWERLRKQVSSFKEIYSLDQAARKAMEKGEMEADPLEKRVVSLIDCTRDVDDLIQDSYLFKFEVLNALAGLIQSSLVRPATITELLQAEQECLRRAESRRRIKVLERILALGGENPKVRRELADALARDQRVDAACIHFSVLAEAEVQRQRPEAAIELYRRILSLSPRHVKSHEQLAAVYAKRGQKREAFVHYHTLFETLRDQSHVREARAAAVAALECDPTHSELRGQLIDLLMADNQREAAAQQLEAQGDLAARAGTVKVAADSYRRAMQLLPASKQLRKKLADVMLTKEDRLARKRRGRLALAAVTFSVLAAAALAFKEHRNGRLFAAAERAAGASVLLGGDAEKAGDYREAKTQYEAALAAYLTPAGVFSPICSYDQKAKREIARLREYADEAERNAVKNREANARRADNDLEAADNAFKAKRMLEAREYYDKVLQNGDAAEKSKLAAKEGREKAQQQIDAFEKALKRLKSPDPNREFAGGVEDEAAEKRRLIEDLRGYPGFDPSTVEMPLLIRPDTDGIQVFLDGRPVGTVNVGGGPEANTFRYPALGTHRFEFRKPGFKTVTLTASMQRPPVFPLRLEREPAVRIDLRPQLPPDVTLSGEPACDGGSLFIGTSEGGLLEVREGESPVVRRYQLRGGGGLNKEVHGPLFLHKRPGGETVIIFCTFAGDCVGLKTAGAAFKEAWPPVKAGQVPLSAGPSVISLKLMTNPVMAMPTGRTLVLVDCVEGLPAAGGPLDFRATITSSASGLDQEALIVAGARDEQGSKLFGYSLRDKALRPWSLNLVVGSLRAKPLPYGRRLLAGADDGRIYLLNPASPSQPPGHLELDQAGAFVGEGLIAGKRLFVGALDREGFWCADLDREQQLWRSPATDVGGVHGRPAVLDNTVYFGTDKGRLYALDIENKGQVRWVYQVEGGSRILGSPLIVGRRVYVVCAEGRIFGFDE